jgi:XRE family transcriptional regulator, regulator of sulfur utilization
MVDMVTSIEDEALSLATLGARVRAERERRGLSAEVLAARSRVSRSMLYEIERGRKAATVLVLDRIATALGTSLARLLDDERAGRVVRLPREDQSVARAEAGWERRILSPALPGIEFEFMRTTLGPRVDAGAFDPHSAGSREYVAVESGDLELILDGQPYQLRAGDAIYYQGDCRHGFRNPRAQPCVYYLVMDLPARSGALHG